MEKKGLMNRLLFGVWAILLVSCSQMELPEMTGATIDPIDCSKLVTPQLDESEWTIERVYFMDNGGGVAARVNRDDLGGKWYFYRSVDKEERIMMSAISDQMFRKDVREYPCITSTFTFADDVYRIHRYDEQSMCPQYHFLIISKKK